MVIKREPVAKTTETKRLSKAASAPCTIWRAIADRWLRSPLVWGKLSTLLFVEYGRRCNGNNHVPIRSWRNMLRFIKHIFDVGEEIWRTKSRVCGIKAYSPQAKGRVERNHGIYQDRFVKELQLKNITSIEEANNYLKKTYLPKINKKFAKKPLSTEDAHCNPKAYGDLNQIFCWEYHRQIRNDFTIRFNNEFYQLGKKQPVRLRSKQNIVVHVHLDGKVSFWKENHQLDYTKLKEPKPKEGAPSKKSTLTSAERSAISKKNKAKTPWSQFNRNWMKKGRSRKKEADTANKGDIFNLGNQGTF